MTRHQKRLSAPTSWPVERKTATFTVKAGAGPHGADGVPLVVLLRDVLGYVETSREASYAITNGGVLVNGEEADDLRRPIGMFDILGFPDRDENYRVFPDAGGRLSLMSIPERAADGKLGKIVDAHHVSGGATQLSLHDGHNVHVPADADHAYEPGDSIVIGFEENEILVHFEYGPGALVTAVDGQHAGVIGEIDEIEIIAGSSPNTVTIETDDETVETIEEYVVVIDENFVTDDDGGDDS